MPFVTILRVLAVVLLVVLVAGLALLFPWKFYTAPVRSRAAATAETVPLGVLGDSDSHSFQDSVSFGDGPSMRGGKYRADTLQWTDVLGRLRPDQVDMGPWGVWGTRLGWEARWQDRLGWPSRFFQKEDYRYNLAMSGATCDQLMDGPRRQAQRLRDLMDLAPEWWRKGVVVIRIGINDVGTLEPMEALAQGVDDAPVLQKIDQCVHDIRRAVAWIRERHPDTGIVVVGIFNNAHWAKFVDRWQDPVQLARIDAALDRFDGPLREWAASQPKTAFFDDRRLAREHWGGRDAEGHPAYRRATLFGLQVTNTAGDEPTNASVADGHNGTAENALFAQTLVRLLNSELGTKVRPIDDAEVKPLLAYGQAGAIQP